MVRSIQLSSYMNGDFGGGPIKAGLPYMVGRTSAVSYAFRQTSQNLTILKGRKYMLNKALQLAITALAAKQLIADAAVITLNNADSTLSDKYNGAIDLYNDGTQFDDNTDINAALAGLISPADDAKIAALNEILTARTTKNNAIIALNQANAELAVAQAEKDAAQTAYDNA
jgi:hypothetical protein